MWEINGIDKIKKSFGLNVVYFSERFSITYSSIIRVPFFRNSLKASKTDEYLIFV
jgi:hypothetical protein